MIHGFEPCPSDSDSVRVEPRIFPIIRTFVDGFEQRFDFKAVVSASTRAMEEEFENLVVGVRGKGKGSGQYMN